MIANAGALPSWSVTPLSAVASRAIVFMLGPKFFVSVGAVVPARAASRLAIASSLSMPISFSAASAYARIERASSFSIASVLSRSAFA